MQLDVLTNVIQQKLSRINDGQNPRVLDLFSGCGGLSLGFYKAGYEITAAIEMDKEAVLSHATNFHSDSPYFKEHSKPRNILETKPQVLFRELGLCGKYNEHVDVIIGGPPCQAFTRIGRAKLRETFSDSIAFLNDPRSQLYKSYLEYVKLLFPLAILMENVPDMLNYGGVNMANLVCEDLKKLGYNARYTLLNTVYYGIPQMRERMFLIAIHESINADILFPAPSHYIELPKGYHGSRQVALKHVVLNSKNLYYSPPPQAINTLSQAVTAADALSDLPEINIHLDSKLKRSIKNLNEELFYKSLAQNDYQYCLREWDGFESDKTVTGNVIRILPRDYPIFKKMKAGDQYPQAIEVAKKILKNKVRKKEKLSGQVISINSKKYQLLLKETIPPYDVKKFPNKWRKMEADKPARTLMAHLGKDCYSHIHYDSKQARTVSVREAARLQSFPDGFRFSGSMNAAFRQIGNAVPPLMAEKIAASLRYILLNG
jgi:DNA (cytosine-5)-methyltransferase 1